jgi:prevent-host-death family protein
MSTQVNIYEAKAKLSDLVERAAAGEEIVIAKNGRPRARLVRVIARRSPRTPGAWKGRVWMAPDFDDDLTDMFECMQDDEAPGA